MCKSVNIVVFRSYQCCPGALRFRCTEKRGACENMYMYKLNISDVKQSHELKQIDQHKGAITTTC